MKNFIKILNALMSLQCNLVTIEMRKKYPLVFWNANPNLYVTMFMRMDFFTMDVVEFMIKYIEEMEEAHTSPRRREAIQSIIHPMYLELTGQNYDTNYLAAYGIESAT